MPFVEPSGGGIDGVSDQETERDGPRLGELQGEAQRLLEQVTPEALPLRVGVDRPPSEPDAGKRKPGQAVRFGCFSAAARSTLTVARLK